MGHKLEYSVVFHRFGLSLSYVLGIEYFNSMYTTKTFKTLTGCPQIKGDLEFLTFCSGVRARLYDQFQNKSTFKLKLGVYSSHINVDLF